MNRCNRCYEIAPCSRCVSPEPILSHLKDYRSLALFAFGAAFLILL